MSFPRSLNSVKNIYRGIFCRSALAISSGNFFRSCPCKLHLVISFLYLVPLRVPGNFVLGYGGSFFFSIWYSCRVSGNFVWLLLFAFILGTVLGLGNLFWVYGLFHFLLHMVQFMVSGNFGWVYGY